MSPTTSTRLSRRSLPCLLAAIVLLAAVACASNPANKPLPKSADTDLEFAGQMALRGNWREAIFRWKRAIEQGQDSARVRNNLAVAYERLGEFELASAEYEAAVEASRGDKQIQENYRQFLRFYRDHKEMEMIDETGADGDE
jgi:Tfp pilus assembly protein PilF